MGGMGEDDGRRGITGRDEEKCQEPARSILVSNSWDAQMELRDGLYIVVACAHTVAATLPCGYRHSHSTWDKTLVSPGSPEPFAMSPPPSPTCFAVVPVICYQLRYPPPPLLCLSLGKPSSHGLKIKTELGTPS